MFSRHRRCAGPLRRLSACCHPSRYEASRHTHWLRPSFALSGNHPAFTPSRPSFWLNRPDVSFCCVRPSSPPASCAVAIVLASRPSNPTGASTCNRPREGAPRCRSRVEIVPQQMQRRKGGRGQCGGVEGGLASGRQTWGTTVVFIDRDGRRTTC
jgi:hypothetical protein